MYPQIGLSTWRHASRLSPRCYGLEIAALLSSGVLFVRHNQAPTDSPLLVCVLVVVLWRQVVRLRRRNFVTASFATVYA
jgi:hypothetical protein